jgi:peptidyl-prolyl cis-trans isomerase SurA
LYSDLEYESQRLASQIPGFNDSLKCELLKQMITQKLLAEYGERDSITVSEEEIEASLDNRIRYFMRTYGSKEALENAAGKSIYQLKNDYRAFTKDELIQRRVLQTITSNIKITPAEVSAFFESYPTDSLPTMPASFEINELVYEPPISEEIDKYAYDKAVQIRKDIVENGMDFDIQAGIYSQDPGSRDNGGDLGVMERDQLDADFSLAAFKLKEGEISQVVKSSYGYHIIQMLRLQGNSAHLRHILIKPEITTSDINKAMAKMDSVRTELLNGKITLGAAIEKYGTDANQHTGGIMMNPETRNARIFVDDLDASLALQVGDLKQGDFSKPHVYIDDMTGNRYVRIVQIRNKIDPHIANLKDDYNEIREMALEDKKNKFIDKWVNETVSNFYISIDKSYKSCPSFSTWTFLQ